MKQFPPYLKPNKPRDPTDLKTSEKTLSPTVTPPASDLDPSIPRHTCKFSHWTTERASEQHQFVELNDEISRLTAQDYMNGLWTLVFSGTAWDEAMVRNGKVRKVQFMPHPGRLNPCCSLHGPVHLRGTMDSWKLQMVDTHGCSVSLETSRNF